MQVQDVQHFHPAFGLDQLGEAGRRAPAIATHQFPDVGPMLRADFQFGSRTVGGKQFHALDTAWPDQVRSSMGHPGGSALFDDLTGQPLRAFLKPFDFDRRVAADVDAVGLVADRLLEFRNA